MYKALIFNLRVDIIHVKMHKLSKNGGIMYDA